MSALAPLVLAAALLVLPVRSSAARRARALRVPATQAPARVRRSDVLARHRRELAGAVVAALLVALLVGGASAVPAAAGAGAAAWAVSRYARRVLPCRRRRAAAEELSLAASWDLLAAALRSGMPVPAALLAVTDGLPDEAARAVRSTADLLALGAGPELAWEPTLDCPDTAEFARAARRTALSGTAVAGVAEDLAVRVRATLTERAEADAQRAGVLIAGPLGLCFLPAFLCLGVAPVVIGLARQLTVL